MSAIIVVVTQLVRALVPHDLIQMDRSHRFESCLWTQIAISAYGANNHVKPGTVLFVGISKHFKLKDTYEASNTATSFTYYVLSSNTSIIFIALYHPIHLECNCIIFTGLYSNIIHSYISLPSNGNTILLRYRP